MRGNVAAEIGPGEAPLLVRLGGKLVLEVLPAALASAIGAFLFAQYQFDHGATAVPLVTPSVAVPASAEMLQVVREEHAMIRDFLVAQRTAQQKHDAAADAADTQAADVPAAADATLAATVSPRTGAAKASVRHGRTIVAASGDAVSTAALPPITITGARPAAAPVTVAAAAQRDATVLVATPASVSATAQPDAGLWPAPPPPAHPSIMASTLAVPGHVVSVTLHAVMAIGGIPSWFGHRFGDPAEPPPSSAS